MKNITLEFAFADVISNDIDLHYSLRSLSTKYNIPCLAIYYSNLNRLHLLSYSSGLNKEDLASTINTTSKFEKAIYNDQDHWETNGVQYCIHSKDIAISTQHTLPKCKLIATLDKEITSQQAIAFDIAEMLIIDSINKTEEGALNGYNLLKSSGNLMALVDKEHIYKVVSAGYEKVFDKSKDKIIGLTVSKLHGTKAYKEKIKPLLDKVMLGSFVKTQICINNSTGNITHLDVHLSPYMSGNHIEGAIVSAHDITQTKQYENSLYDKSIKDCLTGLFNRNYFFEFSNNQLKIINRTGGQRLLLYLDLSNFKQINDQYGHEVGDYALKTIANRLSNGLRDSDIVARLGGDEFSILMIPSDESSVYNIEDINKILTKITHQVGLGIPYNSSFISVGIDIGYVILNTSTTCIDKALKIADLDMYKNKQSNKALFSTKQYPPNNPH